MPSNPSKKNKITQMFLKLIITILAISSSFVHHKLPSRPLWLPNCVSFELEWGQKRCLACRRQLEQSSEVADLIVSEILYSKPP